MTMTHEQALQIMVQRLREALHPRTIVLFGSCARGTAGPDSDIDLLVVMDRVENPMATLVEALRLFPDVTVPKDIVITDSERLARRCRMPHTIESIACAEGRVLYAA